MGKEVFVSIGVSGEGEGVLAMVEHGLEVGRGEVAQLHVKV